MVDAFKLFDQVQTKAWFDPSWHVQCQCAVEVYAGCEAVTIGFKFCKVPAMVPLEILDDPRLDVIKKMAIFCAVLQSCCTSASHGSLAHARHFHWLDCQLQDLAHSRQEYKSCVSLKRGWWRWAMCWPCSESSWHWHSTLQVQCLRSNIRLGVPFIYRNK